MATIQENLTTLSNIKTDIKNAIIGKGIDAGDDITEYGDKIREISGGGEVDPYDYFYFKAIEDSAISFSIYNGNDPNMYYSFDKMNWTAWDGSNIDLNAGEKLYMRAEPMFDMFAYYSDGYERYSQFSGDGYLVAGGNIMSLVNCPPEDNLQLDWGEYTTIGFMKLFGNMTALYDVSALKLPSMVLNRKSYYQMFYGTNIISSPVLPATTLASACYEQMLKKCNNLIFAPYLPATELVENCYRQLFYNSPKVQYIKADFLDMPSSTYTDNWVYGVAQEGCFIKGKNATWATTGTSACPTGWTLITSVS